MIESSSNFFRLPSPAESPRPARRGFTLIELLVVISIIGVLAALSVGLTSVAVRKSKESRIRGEMTKLAGAIENYKSTLGFYPPDHRVAAVVPWAIPSPNQLYYELSGTIYNDVNRTFSLPGSQYQIGPAQMQQWFGTTGFSNSAKNEKDLKFTEDFKASQFHQIDPSGITVLAVPVPGPTSKMTKFNGVWVNPWMYVSTSPTNNPDRYDLWTEVVIGKHTFRFSNWEKDAVPLD